MMLKQMMKRMMKTMMISNYRHYGYAGFSEESAEQKIKKDKD